jgi:hypothetical protein
MFFSIILFLLFKNRAESWQLSSRQALVARGRVKAGGSIERQLQRSGLMRQMLKIKNKLWIKRKIRSFLLGHSIEPRIFVGCTVISIASHDTSKIMAEW